MVENLFTPNFQKESKHDNPIMLVKAGEHDGYASLPAQAPFPLSQPEVLGLSTEDY